MILIRMLIKNFNTINDYSENYKDGCDKSSDYEYINCKVSVDGKTITVTKEADLDGDYNKEEATKMILESIKNDYSESDIYTCE